MYSCKLRYFYFADTQSNHLTLSERKNGNFQSIEKISIHAYFLFFSFSFSFTSFRFLNTVVQLENTDPVIREESKEFFLSYTHTIIY